MSRQSRTWARRPANPAPMHGTPLKRKTHEAFARAYRACFDGPEAARQAGYTGRFAERIWPVLLRRPDIRDRLRGLGAEVDRADISTEAVLAQLLDRAFVNLSPIIDVDAMTGKPRFDLGRARPEQINALDIEQKTVEGPRGTQRTTTIRTRSPAEILNLLLRALADHRPDPAKAQDGLERLIAEINQRGSRPPIATRAPSAAPARAEPVKGTR